MNTSAPTHTKVWQVRNSFFGVYIHYPYCIQKCDYCDFYSEGIGLSPSENEQALFDAYHKELKFRKSNSAELQTKKLDTLFFGGGTPSKANLNSISRMIETVTSEFQISQDLEISIEVNPEDLTIELLNDYKSIGINRVNVGVQTLNPEGLLFLGRHYDEVKYNNLIHVLEKSPIPRVGIDLMYGIPGVSEENFFDDLNLFLKIGLPHLSLYSLTLEKGTNYSRDVKENRKNPPLEEVQTNILSKLPSYMKEKGYNWYEVSNFAKPGFESRHNIKYWTYEPYLGLGPGAHGFLDGNRYGNPRNTNVYLKDPTKTKSNPAEPGIELALTLFRLFAPFHAIGFFDAHLDHNTKAHFLKTIEVWQKKGYCTFSDVQFQWNESALLLLDELILELSCED